MAWMRQDQDTPTTKPRYSPDPQVEVVRQKSGAITQPAALIGKTVSIKGDLTAEEDVVIDGKVEGKVSVKKNRVTVGASGKIQADVRARWVVVSGEVNGSITAGDRLEITSGGRVMGDVQSPRLVIAEGARLQGAVDTDPVQATKAPGKHRDPKPQTEKRSGSQSSPSSAGEPM